MEFWALGVTPQLSKDFVPSAGDLELDADTVSDHEVDRSSVAKLYELPWLKQQAFEHEQNASL